MRQNYLTEHIKDKNKIVSIQEKVKYERKGLVSITYKEQNSTKRKVIQFNMNEKV